MIRITKRVIRIPIPISLHEDRDPNHYSSDLNQATRKRFEWLLNNRVIRIPPQRIQIQISVRELWWTDSNHYSSDSNHWCRKSEVESHRFESPIQQFESFMKNKWKDWSTDSNHLYSDSNHSWRTRQGDSNLWVTVSNLFTNEAKGWKSDRAIQIINLLIRITQWHKIQLLQRWFESPK